MDNCFHILKLQFIQDNPEGKAPHLFWDRRNTYKFKSQKVRRNPLQMFHGNSDPILRRPQPFISFLSLKDSEVIPVIPKINLVSKDIHRTYICMPTCVHACLDIIRQWLSLNPNLQQFSQFSVITHLHICTQILFEKGVVFVAFNRVIVLVIYVGVYQDVKNTCRCSTSSYFRLIK